MNSLIAEVKEAGEDYEFYPTTSEIVRDVYRKLPKDKSLSILDIGAGNGNFFVLLEEFSKEDDGCTVRKYAIEKSQILINNMPADIFIVGTDFYEQSLIDKKMDVIFCNPPYSDFEGWAIKVITECNCKDLFLVIPERWKNSEGIKSALKARSTTAQAVRNYTFKDSEFRKARAVVDLLHISFKTISYYNQEIESDPFEIWFDTYFKISADQSKKEDYNERRTKEKEIRALVGGKNIIENLVELYNKDKDKLLSTYKALEKLDYSIMKELNVNLTGLKEGLRLKIEGLKSLYWKELFNNFTVITDKLTSSSRNNLLGTLTAHTSIDFTASNAYSVTIWAIKNANKYFDSQLLKMYETLTQKENVINYKSNNRIIEDGWRYSRWDYVQKASHYKLDYRIVHHHYNAIQIGWSSFDYEGGLNRTAHDIINDIITIAKNLGFNVTEGSYSYRWEAGKTNVFETYKNDKFETFAEIKAFKNGNIHFKFNQDFMKKFNIEAGRLNGWIKSPKEASEEMDIPIKEATEYFKSNIKLLNNNVKLLEGRTE